MLINLVMRKLELYSCVTVYDGPTSVEINSMFSNGSALLNKGTTLKGIGDKSKSGRSALCKGAVFGLSVLSLTEARAVA